MSKRNPNQALAAKRKHVLGASKDLKLFSHH